VKEVDTSKALRSNGVDVSVPKMNWKDKAGEASNRWMERNRSLVLRQTPVWAQSMGLMLVSLGGIALLGSIFFKIDEVVSVKGQLKSIGGTVEVETPAGGQVAEVLFADGDLVKKDQLLIRFDTRQAQKEASTLKKLIDLEQRQAAAQNTSYESQIITLKGRLDVLNKRIDTKKIIVSEMQSLVQQGGFQRIQYLEELDKLFELNKQISEAKEQISRVRIEQEKLSLESNKSINQMKSSLSQAELQLQYQNVRSPSTGIVFDPQASVDGVLNPGERILSIVPKTGLMAEVYVPNQDIGFVKKGQEAKVRVDAFPFTRYGEIPATVSSIAADALLPDQTYPFYRFPVKLQLKNSYLENNGAKIPLKPGMSITTNLKLRDKRVISLISDLLVDQTDSVRTIRQQ